MDQDGLQVELSPELKKRRLARFVDSHPEREHELRGLVEDAQLLGSLQLAGCVVTWDEVRHSRDEPAATPEVARWRTAREAVPADAPFTIAAVSTWHAALVSGFDAGKPRTGDLGDSFDPPPAPGEFVRGRLEILEQWLDADSTAELEPAQLGALVLARLVEIRPFAHGNGRIARLATSHMMCRGGGRPPILMGGDAPRLEAALQKAFQLDMAPLAALLDEAQGRGLDVMLEAVRADDG